MAFDKKKLIGFIIGFYTIPWKSQFIPSYIENYKYYISSLYVLKEYQRKKIGTKLINSLINHCKYKINEFFLTINCNNSNAIIFYEKLGFKFIKKIEKYNLFLYKLSYE